MIKIICVLALFFVSLMGNVHATPLRMDYTTTDLGGSYLYDFTLTLDNHDGSWALGKQWDWINFGDTDYAASTYVGFDIDGSGGVSADWTTLTTSSGDFSISGPSGGSHNAPYVQFGSNILIPGWMPSSVGESFSWSGTSGVYIDPGDLYWSSLITAGGASLVQFEQANHITSVPEPSISTLLASGLLIFDF